MLRNRSTNNDQSNGAIVGCRWTEGRWSGKDALEFKHPGDRVRLQIPGEFDSLTWSAWVRIDGLDRPFIALMLTNGYEVGEPPMMTATVNQFFDRSWSPIRLVP